MYHLYHPPLFHISSPTHNPHGTPFALPLPILSSSTSRPARNSGRRKSPTTLRMLSSNIRPATPTSLTGPETCNLGEQSIANALDVQVSRRRRSPLRRMLFLLLPLLRVWLCVGLVTQGIILNLYFDHTLLHTSPVELR